MHRNYIFELKDIPAVARDILAQYPTCTVFTFTGDLGAGKTTLIREIVAQCGILEPVTSPTFALLNIYRKDTGLITCVYHFDLYRITTAREFLDAGLEEYLYKENSIACIEWPLPIATLLTHHVCNITLKYISQLRRKIEISSEH